MNETGSWEKCSAFIHVYIDSVFAVFDRGIIIVVVLMREMIGDKVVMGAVVQQFFQNKKRRKCETTNKRCPWVGLMVTTVE